MKTELNKIRTYGQLLEARNRVETKIEQSKAGMTYSFGDLKRSLSPVIFLKETLSRVLESIDFATIGASFAKSFVGFIESRVINKWGRNRRLVIFDLDGTLLDTADDLGAAVNHALSKRNLPLHSSEEYKLMVGNGVRNLVKRALPEELAANPEYVESALLDFRAYYSEHIDDHTRPYEGIPELLEWMYNHGIKLAVVSNKFQEGTERLIKGFFPNIPFVGIYGNVDGVALKPDPYLVNRAMEAAGAGKGTTVIVGDSQVDIKTAANAGIRSIAVTWGFRPESELAAADDIVTSVQELKEKFM